MKNEKNFILSLKFPFSLVKENRVIMFKPGDTSADGGAEAGAGEGAKVDEKVEAGEKRTKENTERSEKVSEELGVISKKSEEKEQQLAKVVEDFKKIPVPVDPEKVDGMHRGKVAFREAIDKYAQDKADYDIKKDAYDKQVAAIRLELMGMRSRQEALMREMKMLEEYKDPRVEADVAKMDMEQLVKDLDEGQKKFFDGLVSRLDSAKISELRSKFQINADTWSITSASGLNALKKDWTNLKIYEDTPFFNNIFDQLARLSDPNELKTLKPGEEKMYSSVEEKKKVYLAPEANVRKIGDKALASAVSFFVAIKTLLKTQDNFQTAANERNQGKDQDKIAATGIKFVTDNVRKFQDAIKQKDWGTALVYVIAGYVAYKGAMKIWEKTPDWTKTGIYAAGFLYAANMFAKNAGYDPLKALGITASEDEVRGTALANFYHLNLVPEGKDLDGRVLLDIGGLSVADLNGLYFEPHGGDIKAIDPNQLPGHFPQFRGLSASVLSKDGPLTSKEEEYRRVGREIYKIAKAIRESYDKYIKPRNGLIIEEALSKDPDLKDATVMSFAMVFNGIAQSGRERLSGGILDSLGLSVASFRMKRRFDAVFKDKQMDFEAENKPISAGVYSAQVMNFPVVIREDGVNKKYVVFSRDDYNRAGGNPDAVTQALCEIPFEGNADEQVEKLKDSVIGRFTKVVEELNKSAKESLDLEKVKYVSGKFVSRLTVKAGSMLGKEETMDVFLKVSKDGSTVEVYRMTDGELIINLDSTGDRSKLLGNLVMAGLCRQDDMKPFFFLYKAKKLEFKGQNMDADGSFDVLAGDSKVLIKFKLDKATGRYVFAEAGAEAKLFDVNNYGFLRELAENAVKENTEWKKEVERFGNVLDGIPEGYMYNLFKNVPNWWKDATSDRWFRGFKLEQFSGSIPKNYTNAMIDAQAEFLISKTVAGLATGGSLDKAAKVMDDDSDIKASAFKLQKLTQKLSNIKEQNQRDGKEMTSEEFKTQILDGASKLAVKSNTYSLWYEAFASSIFMKYGKDGIIPGRVNKAAKIVSVFAAYTYKMDVVGMDRSSVDSVDYKKRAAYTNYVAERMFMKLNEDKMPDEVPQRGPFWEIDDWGTFSKDWKNPKYATVGVTLKDPEGNDERGEILVETGALKMSKDYVTFDAWLGKSTRQRKKYNKNNVVLSKDTEEHTVGISTDEEYEFYLDLLDNYEHDDTIETIKHTQLQKEFYNALRKGIVKLKGEFVDYLPQANSTKATRFQKLQDESYVLNLETLTPSPSAGLQTPPFSLKYKIKNNVFWGDTTNLEEELATFARKNNTVITESIQRKFITEKVKKILSDRIAGEDTWDEYFEKKTTWELFKIKSGKFIDNLNLF
ncbi:MAG: hypothetical protein Q8P62_01770 [Candidatus Peregrinibacteria bacterium]|nr:hypothetical protein [Candidatus Peregrinibacteria bacterium]